MLGYILYGIYMPKEHLNEKECREVQIAIDTLDRHFISAHRIVSILTDAHLYPKGKAMKDIRTRALEVKLEENSLIKKASVYKTPSGVVKIEVCQRLPLLRVMTPDESYYIDSEGKIMPVAGQVAVYVPVATGSIDRQFARRELYGLARFLHDDKFWEMQTEQIHVYPNREIEITPRVGNHQILLGKADGFEEKFRHLRLFYEQALNEAGWNRYSKINLKYKNQIICTKRL